MDAFDFTEEPEEQKPRRKPGSVLLTLGMYFFLAASLILIGFYLVIYLDPYNPINPLMPPTPVETEEISTNLPKNTATPQVTKTLPPTPTNTVPPTPPQVTPTETPIPFPTATDVVLSTSEPDDTPEGVAHYTAQEGTPAYIPYSGGCSGVYVAGNVIDIDDRPVVLLTVRGEPINIEVLSGSNTNYSESGWEIKLSDQMISTTGEITVGLYTQGAIDPISDLVTIDTFNDCTRNLAVVNFVQDQ